MAGTVGSRLRVQADLQLAVIVTCFGLAFSLVCLRLAFISWLLSAESTDTGVAVSHVEKTCHKDSG